MPKYFPSSNWDGVYSRPGRNSYASCIDSRFFYSDVDEFACLQTLPQFLPKTIIEFNPRLGEVQVKELELSNPSRKAIAYTAKLEGHADFSVDGSTVRIDAQVTGPMRSCVYSDLHNATTSIVGCCVMLSVQSLLLPSGLP